MKIRETLRIARIARKNGNASKREKREALEAAQKANVTGLDYLRASAMLRAADGNSEMVKRWLSEMEPGSFADNLELFTVSLHLTTNGNVSEGRRTIELLRQHIVRIGDPKSMNVLLPAIEAALAAADSTL